MTISLQILRFSGIVWLATVFGKTVGRIDAYFMCLDLGRPCLHLTWPWLIIGITLAIALIWGTTWLIDKRKPG